MFPILNYIQVILCEISLEISILLFFLFFSSFFFFFICWLFFLFVLDLFLLILLSLAVVINLTLVFFLYSSSPSIVGCCDKSFLWSFFYILQVPQLLAVVINLFFGLFSIFFEFLNCCFCVIFSAGESSSFSFPGCYIKCGGARDITFIVVGNGHGDTSSNPRRGG